MRRTTSSSARATRSTSAFVQGFLQRLYDNGHVYQDVYAGLYCVGCEAFKTEADLVDGKCPEHDRGRSGSRSATGSSGSRRSSSSCSSCTSAPTSSCPGFRANEARSFIEGGLQDFSISRAGQTWGIPIPWDPDSVAYVWADALVNYLSALTYARPGEDLRRDVLAVGAAPARQGHPALPLRLLARDAARRRVRAAAAAVRPRVPAARRPEDLEVARQRRRPARPDRRLRRRSGPLLVRAGDLVRPGRRRVDRGDPGALRARARQRSRQPPLADDGDGRALPRRHAARRCRRRTAPSPQRSRRSRPTSPIGSTHFDVTGALERIWEVVRALNREVETTAPWQLAKDDARADELDRVLYDLVDGLRAVAIALSAYVPDTAAAILVALGSPPALDWSLVAYGLTGRDGRDRGRPAALPAARAARGVSRHRA